MKKLLMILAVTVFSAQGGYCAGSALDNLQKLGDVKNVSVPVSGSPVAIAGNKLETAGERAGLGNLSGTTAFEKLKSLFNEGVPAVKEDLIGWYSGRFVRDWDPENILGAILMGKEALDGGPLFSDELGVDTHIDILPDYFDHMSGELLANMNDLFKIINGTSIRFPAAAGREGNGDYIQYRKARGYIVERVFNEQTIYVRGQYYKSSECYSYYFLNVTPKK